MRRKLQAARQSTDLPPTDAAWIDDDSAMTARNVVNALCRLGYY